MPRMDQMDQRLTGMSPGHSLVAGATTRYALPYFLETCHPRRFYVVLRGREGVDRLHSPILCTGNELEPFFQVGSGGLRQKCLPGHFTTNFCSACLPFTGPRGRDRVLPIGTGPQQPLSVVRQAGRPPPEISSGLSSHLRARELHLSSSVVCSNPLELTFLPRLNLKLIEVVAFPSSKLANPPVAW